MIQNTALLRLFLNNFHHTLLGEITTPEVTIPEPSKPLDQKLFERTLLETLKTRIKQSNDLPPAPLIPHFDFFQTTTKETIGFLRTLLTPFSYPQEIDRTVLAELILNWNRLYQLPSERPQVYTPQLTLNPMPSLEFETPDQGLIALFATTLSKHHDPSEKHHSKKEHAILLLLHLKRKLERFLAYLKHRTKNPIQGDQPETLQEQYEWTLARLKDIDRLIGIAQS